MHLHNYFQTVHSGLLHFFLPEQLKLEGRSMGGCKFGNMLPINVPKSHRGTIYGFWSKNFQNCLDFSIWNPVSTLLLGILLKPWTLSFKNDGVTAKTVSQLKCLEERKVEVYLAKERSGLAFFSTDQGHIFGSNVGNEFWVMLRGKGPHKPDFAYDIVCIHSLMIYTDLTELIEYKIVGDTKAPLLRCFRFISKLKSGDIITTGPCMKYQTFTNLQFRPLLKVSFHSIHIDLRNTSGERLPFVFVGITRLVLMFRNASNIHFQSKRHYRMVASRQVDFPFYRCDGRQRGRGFG